MNNPFNLGKLLILETRLILNINELLDRCINKVVTPTSKDRKSMKKEVATSVLEDIRRNLN